MQERYILKQNEPINELADKLINGYWINKLIIYFDKVIEDLDDFNYIFIGDNKNSIVIEIITKYYFNNILYLILPPIKPFYIKYINKNSYIQLYKNSSDNRNIKNIEYYIKPCLNIKLSMKRINNDFLNNYFTNEQFKNYIMMFSNVIDIEFEKWFENFYSNNYELSLDVF